MTYTKHSVAAVFAVAVLAAVGVGASDADSPPVGPLPSGPVSSITSQKGELVAVALPQHSGGLVWRIARAFDGNVVQEVNEAEAGGNVIVVFKATGTGTTSIRFGLTRGERQKAYQSRRFDIHIG
jgi:hypothetical protein